MFDFALSSSVEAYQKPLLDVIRIFAPHFTWCKDADAGQLLHLKDDGQIVKLFVGDVSIVVAPSGLGAHDVVHQLKQAFYQYLRDTYQLPDNPWGMLTGIRPLKLWQKLREQGMAFATAQQHLSQAYFVAPAKVALLAEVADVQEQTLTRHQPQVEAGLYIGIPFCPTKCSYCSFPSYPIPGNAVVMTYLQLLAKELEAMVRLATSSGFAFTYVYIGGGTPSSLTIDQLAFLLKTLATAIDLAKLKEFTVEAGRADTLDPAKLRLLKDSGVGRISINPQTFQDKTYSLIGRHHSVADVLQAYTWARQIGFDGINMDLILGLPGETLVDFQNSLTMLEGLSPENITVHALALKRASCLKAMDQFPHTHCEALQMAEHLSYWYPAQGYMPYYLYRQKQMIGNLENIGFTKPGHISPYNILMIAEQLQIYGIGVGATSKIIDPTTWRVETIRNPKDLRTYFDKFDEMQSRKVDKIVSLWL